MLPDIYMKEKEKITAKLRKSTFLNTHAVKVYSRYMAGTCCRLIE